MSKSTAKRQWDLNVRWKVVAVLAVPLLVALTFGAFSIQAKFSEANHLASAADNIDIIYVVNDLSFATGDLAGRQTVPALDPNVAPGSSVATDEEISKLQRAINAADRARSASVPGGLVLYDGMVTVAREVLSNGKKLMTAPKYVTDKSDAVRQAAMAITEAAVEPVTDSGVASTKAKLIDARNAYNPILHQSAAMIAVAAKAPNALREFLGEADGERALLGAMARRYPPNDPVIRQLREALDKRVQLVSAGASGEMPWLDVQQAFLSSSMTYERLISEYAKSITTAVHRLADSARTAAIRDSVIVALALVTAIGVATAVSLSLIRPLRKLRVSALRVANEDLPQAVERIRKGSSIDEVTLAPMPVSSREEVGQLARAVESMQEQALRLAGEQAQLRVQVNDMFETLARRSKSLVDHQLSLLERLESQEKDPALLESLFRLDHLAARMRRNGENLLILAGTQIRRARTEPVEIADVLRAAISEVEEYQRVKLGGTPRGSIVEPAASDMAHLFAELLDNALRASPPESDVKFTFAHANDHGLLIEVADRGIGIPEEEMELINARLKAPAEVATTTARHMGLFVVGRLADRHGLSVWMRSTFDIARDPGVTVTVHVPQSLIISPASPVAGAGQTALDQQAAAEIRRSGALPALPSRAGRTSAISPAPPAAAWTPGGVRGSLLGAASQERTELAESEQSAEEPRLGSAIPLRQLTGSWPVADSGPEPRIRGPVPPSQLSGPIPIVKQVANPELPQRAKTMPSAPPEKLSASDSEHESPGDSPRSPSRQPDTARTASFFTRGQPLPAEQTAETPIFAEMMSAWLSDPASVADVSFASDADAGWAAAGRLDVIEAGKTMAGLPRRLPGERLVPGGVAAGPGSAPRRDPELVRRSLSRHQRGVREGRAASSFREGQEEA